MKPFGFAVRWSVREVRDRLVDQVATQRRDNLSAEISDSNAGWILARSGRYSIIVTYVCFDRNMLMAGSALDQSLLEVGQIHHHSRSLQAARLRR